MAASNSVKPILKNNSHAKNPDDESDDTPTPTADDECDDDGHKAECGIGTFKPAILQMCASMPVYTGFYSISALMTSTLSSYVNSQVTTLEKHFGFSSTQTGLIMAANDVGFLAIILFVSFMASRVHIPRALASFTILFGVSGIVCALPYFLFGAPSPTSSDGADVSNVSAMTSGKSSGSFLGQLCDGDTEASLNCSVSTEDPGETSRDVDPGSMARTHGGTALVIIVLGMVLQGMAKTPRYSFTACYVDNNVDKVKTGFYMGIIITIAIMGPALAYALGAMFTRIYVTLEDTDMTFRHPRWIGAWWLGYVTFGCGACVFALPLFCFPRSFKGGKQKRLRHTGPDVENVFERLVKLVKGFLEAMIRLWTNPVYMCIVMAGCSLMFAGAGSHSFFPKYIENQFDFPAWKANMAIAGIILGTACVGTFVGGYLTKRLKMGPMASLKFTMAMATLAVLFTGALIFFKCDQPYLYNSPGPRAADSSGLDGCLDSCVCDDGDFFPVCGQDGRTFFSPCHAGCQETANGNYVNCTCIEGGTAVAGMCDYGCVMFYPFIICCGVSTLFGTLAIIPKLIIYIRSVEDRDKALALGFKSFMMSTLGWMLGPILFGRWIDGICIQWEHSCTGSGACRLYDNDTLRMKLMGYQLIFRILALVFYGLTYVSARVTKRFETNNSNNKGELKEGAAKMMLMGQNGANQPIREDFADPD